MLLFQAVSICLLTSANFVNAAVLGQYSGSNSHAALTGEAHDLALWMSIGKFNLESPVSRTFLLAE